MENRRVFANSHPAIICKAKALPYVFSSHSALRMLLLAPCTLLLALFAISCGSSGMSGGNASSEVNNSPQAIIMVNQTEVTAGSEIVLDGSQSVDPEAGAITYRWYECEKYLIWLQNMGYEEDSPYYLSCDGNAQTGLLNIPSVPGPQSDFGDYAEGPTQAVTFPDDGDGEYTFILVVNDGELDSPPRDVVINVTPAPSASRPFAMAFADPTGGVPGAKIILNGSKSEASTAGRTITEYQWYENAANPQLNLIKKVALLPYASGVTQAVWPVTPGTYRFTLIVIDSGGTYSSPNNNDEVQITVSALNSAPTASAGLNRVAKRGELVTLNGSGSSDPDSGTTLSYSWSLSSWPSGSSASLSNPTTQQPSFTPDVSGNYIATLVVNDGQLASPPASVKIQCNFPPYPIAGANQTVAIGELVTLDGSGSFDSDLDPLTYSWIMSPPTGSVASLNSLIVARPTFVPDREGNYIFRLALNDGLEDSDYPAWVTVTAVNRRPVAVAKASPNPVSLAGTVQLNGSSSYDPEGYPVTYAWSMRSRPAGSPAMIIYPNAVTPTFVADLVGNFLVKLVVNDGFIDSYADWITVTATNLAPLAVAQAIPSNPTIKVDQVQLDGTRSSDPESASLTYQWTQHWSSNPKVIISNANTSSATAGTFPNAVTYSFVLTVTDNGGLQSKDLIIVSAKAGNTRPDADARVNSLNQANVGFYDSVTLDGRFSYDPDAGDKIVSYSWRQISGLPVDLEMTEWPKAVTFTAPDELSELVFSLEVSDGKLLSYPDYVTVSVWKSVFTSSQMGDRFVNGHLGQPAGLFVSQSPKADDVPYCGDPVTSPCKTISYAIHNRWPTTVTADVYAGTWTAWGKYSNAATGTYKENVVIYDPAAGRGVSIFGGFFEDGTGKWWRDMDRFPTAVTITTVAEVVSTGVVSCDLTSPGILITNSTYIDGFKIKCNPSGAALHYGILCDSSMVTIRNNSVYGNNSGGTSNWAIYISDGASGAGSPAIVNNYINGGTAGGGPPNETYGIYFDSSGIDSLVAHNLIFAGNPNPGTSYGIAAQSDTDLPSTPTIMNNIINAGSGTTGQYGIYENGTYADTKVYNNNILLGGVGGTQCLYYDADGPVCRGTIGSVNSMMNAGNNISVNPKFVDYLGGNYHLLKESQCIDAGTDAGIRVDKGGNKRPVDVRLPDGTDVDNNPLDAGRNIFDIGPYEYPNAVSQP
jgi:hypothetical protein